MKIPKSRIYVGTIFKSLSRYGKNLADDDTNTFGIGSVQNKVFLIRFGKDSYVPVSSVKNALHLLILDQKVQKNGATKYSPEFLHTFTDMDTNKYVGKIKPAFSMETSQEKIGLSTLKKFSKIMENSKNTLEKI